jgi:hypothetical protein
MEGARAHRIIVAVLQNIGNWQDRLADIEAAAIPGNKARVLELMRDVAYAKLSLCRLAEMEGEPVCQRPAGDKPPET